MRALLYFWLILILGACARFPDPAFVPGASPRRLPVTVAYLADADYRDAFELAVEFWNDAIPGCLAEVPIGGPDADVVVTQGSVYGTLRASSDPRTGVIYLHQPGDPYQALLTLEHELGHAAFWLTHDYAGCSVMRPHVADVEVWRGSDVWGRPPAAFVRVCVTESDRRAISGAQ